MNIYNIPKGQHVQLQATHQATSFPKGIKGVFGGFIAFFLFTYGITIIQLAAADTKILSYFSSDLTALLLIILFNAFLVINIFLFISIIYSAKKLRPNTVALLKIGVLAAFITSTFGQGFISGVFGNKKFSLDTNTMASIFIFLIIFFLYLSFSKRVHSTFPRLERKFQWREKLVLLLTIAIPVSMYFVPILVVSKWINFYSTEGHFKIDFPSYPTMQKTSQPREDLGVTLDQIIYQNDTGKVLYMAGFINFPSVVHLSDAKTELQKIIDAMSAQPNNELVSSNFIIINGYDMVDFHIKNTSSNIYYKGRSILAGQTIYTLIVGSIPENSNIDNYNKFVNSFSIE